MRHSEENHKVQENFLTFTQHSFEFHEIREASWNRLISPHRLESIHADKRDSCAILTFRIFMERSYYVDSL